MAAQGNLSYDMERDKDHVLISGYVSNLWNKFMVFFMFNLFF